MGKPHIRRFALVSCLLALLCGGLAAPALADPCTNCACIYRSGNNPRTVTEIKDQHKALRTRMTTEFNDWKNWLFNTFWRANLLPSMMEMTKQIATTTMQNALSVGMFLDAKQQLEVQRLFQQKTAEAHRDYHPSQGMCVIGTNVRSLAAAERRADFTSFVLSQRSLDRQMGNQSSAAASGPPDDMKARMAQFKKHYCDPRENDNGMGKVCGTAAPALTRSKDIDFTGSVYNPLTLNVDFTNATITDDERAVFALSNLLYSHDVMRRIPERTVRDKKSSEALILDQRAIIAKRSVAEQAFQNLVGIKSQGTGSAAGTTGAADTAKYMKIILQQFGLSPDDAGKLLGANPSYYAQMELLTKKMYENPTFYTDLYDKPANIDRKKVALQAIGLMQDFDTWESYLRTEAMLSVLLETELNKRQEKLDNIQNNMKSSGSRRKEE